MELVPRACRVCAASQFLKAKYSRISAHHFRFLRAAARNDSIDVRPARPAKRSGVMPKAQAPDSGPAVPMQAPPWVRTRGEFESKYWLGRKEVQIPWVKKKFDDLVKNESIDGWNSFFKNREENVSGVNTLLRVFLAREQPRKALDLFDEMKKRGFEPDKFAYVNAISACADLKDPEKGIAFFNELKSKYEVDIRAYVTLMTCYSAVGNAEKAQMVMKEAQASGIQPNRVMYTALLTAYANVGNLSRSLELLQEMRMAGEHPDAVAYNTVLHACGRSGDGFKALDIFDEMRQYGIPRDVKAFNSAIQACSVAGLEEDASLLLNEMLANKYQGDGSCAPTKRTYTIIIQYFANKGDLESATAMLASMVDEGLPADAKAHATLIDSCIFHAGWAELMPQRIAWAERAEALFEKAMRSLPSPLAPSDAGLLLTKLVCAWALTNDSHLVRPILSRFHEFPGARPGPLVFAALLNMCERCCDGKLAVETLRGMQQQAGLIPSPAFWCRAALAYVRANDPEPALRLLEEASERGVKLGNCVEWRVLPEALGRRWVPPNEWDLPHGGPHPSKAEEAAFQAALAAIKV